MNNSLCNTCAMSIWCPIWTNFKCLKHLRRFENGEINNCDDYKRRPKVFKERPCRCEDCLRDGVDREEVEV